MPTPLTIQSQLQDKLATALTSAGVELPEGISPAVSISADLRFGDYQSNVAMMFAKKLKMNPRELATKIVSALEDAGVADLASMDIAGPGFINFRVSPQAWAERVNLLIQDDRLGVPSAANPDTIVVDFSAPNVAKPMHVGHIRSTIIGDSLSRISRFLGHNVITDNHIGDWGTQFGMVIYGWKNLIDQSALEAAPLQELLRIYRAVNVLYKEDPEIAEICKNELVKLQSGDQEIWQKCVDVSKLGLNSIYDRLEVSFDHWFGESYYNDKLEPLTEALKSSGAAQLSDGALCVFSSGELEPKQDPFKKNEDGEWIDLPMIVRKEDGGFNYATTDIATIDFRLTEWNADKIWYVVDARQALHFRQLFDIAKRRGCQAELEHVTFGTILGKDGKPLKTRDGDLPQLEDVLNDAIAASRAIIEEKSADLPTEEKDALAISIGIGSVKFTELSHNRNSDYVFDLDKMVALQGDTAPYLQYSNVRCQSIFRKLDLSPDFSALQAELSEDGEIHLTRMLARYGEILPTVLDDLRPNILANYLLELARSFHSFFEACPVLKSDGNTQLTRLALCELTSRVLAHGLSLLGIATPNRM